MSGIHVATCPYCRTRNVAFRAVHDFDNMSGQHRALFQCGNCYEGVIWSYVTPLGLKTVATLGDLDRNHFFFDEQWPEISSTSAPADTPENVSRFFEQATDSLNNGNFDAAGMMFRKTLESATKYIDPNLVKLPLRDRIRKLVDQQLVTPSLGDWADEIRISGNEAAHEDELFSEEDATALHAFIENFLRYAFTLPAAVARRRAPAT
jgi:hypothetical protein